MDRRAGSAEALLAGRERQAVEDLAAALAVPTACVYLAGLRLMLRKLAFDEASSTYIVARTAEPAACAFRLPAVEGGGLDAEATFAELIRATSRRMIAPTGPGDGTGAAVWFIHRPPGAEAVAVQPRGVGFVVEDRGDSITLHVQYADGTITGTMAVALAAAFRDLMGSVAQDAGRPASSYRLGATGRDGVLEGRARKASCGASVVDMIRKAAREAPDRVAIRGLSDVTFAELDDKVARCASHLASLGVRSVDRVAMYMPRSADWIIAALAVRWLGACYVPFESSTPERRVAEQLSRLAPSLVLVSDPSVQLPGACACDERFWSAVSRQAPREPVSPALDRPAYILHTSGSTGQAKAVEVAEQSLLNYVDWACRQYELPALDGAILHTSLAVDLTVTSLWVPLAAGRTIVLADSTDSVASVATLLQSSHRWLLKLTPTHLRALRLWHEAAGLPLRFNGAVVLGGEELRRADLVPWLGANAEVVAYNEYGPTECTVGCAVERIRGSDAEEPAIGRPIDNCVIRIADCDGSPLPDGLPGELLIGGVCVAMGYVSGDSDKRFIDDSRLGGRAYRSGDRAAVGADGRLELFGRLDSQIKVRGHRIEPAEVESALAHCDGIVDAAVAKVEHPRHGEALAAYCVLRDGSVLDPVALRSALSRVLPPELMPNGFVQVPAIPHNAAGKRDIAALSSRYPLRGVSFATYTAPRTPTEEILCAVLARVLDVDRVGIDDDYFALGGDSLRSIRVTALAERRGVRFALPLLHEQPTARLLAAAIDAGKSDVRVDAVGPFSLLTNEERRQLPPDVDDAYPLNLLQEGMIYHREFSPRSAVYHAICSYRVRAPFDLGRIRTAVQNLVGRHPALRTSFDLTSYNRPLQLVHRDFPNPLGFEDLSGRTDDEQAQRIDDWMEEEKRQGFELEGFPLIRFMMHRLGDDLFQLSYSFHHEIVDGWSDALMVTELMTEYLRSVRGEPAAMEAPKSRFSDSIVLEQQAIANKAYEEFWQRRLDDVSVMHLPNLRGPHADKGEREIVKFEVPVQPPLSDGLKRLAKSLAVPLKTVLLAAHLKVMSVIGGTSDVMTYTVSNGRPENRDGHALVGLFVNSLAFRQKLGGGTWSSLIYDTLATEHESLPYRRFPMAEIKRQHGSEPLSETLFFFNNYHVAEALEQFDELQLLGLKVYAESTFPYCINAYVEPFTHNVRLRIEYDRLQYSAVLMEDIKALYASVLAAMVANPSARYDASCMLPESRQRALRAVSDAVARRRSDTTVLDMFTAAAERTPDRTAVVCGERALSYAELTQRAEATAARLRASGVRAGSTVAIAMRRSADTVVAMLATHKCGAAYVPLEVPQPAERLQYIFDDVAAELFITSADDAEFLPRSAPRLVIDSAPSPRGPGSTTSARVDLAPSMPAYVIYTSGTTGQPKGVAIDHAALANSTLARTQHYGKDPAVFLLLSSHSVDSSVAGLFWTLCSGGTLVIAEDLAQMEPGALWATIHRHSVSHLLCVPSLYSALVEEAPPAAKVPHFNTAIVAGEACPSEVWAMHRLRLPHVALHNEYGPTEAAVWATVQRCDKEVRAGTLPIGQAIVNVSTYVLDHDLNLTPFDVQGELYIGGAGLALGYVANTDATAERFVPNPFGAPGERLYRTGDLVRRSADGTLDFLGRTDHMVKIQGFRVEVAEVESALEKHEMVKRALVQARAVDGHRNELVAYVIPAGDAVRVEELRAHLKKLLPKYMMPAVFVTISNIPIRQSGKIDYAALPQPVRERDRHDVARTATEAALIDIWKGVLGLDEIGIHEDFFELGGESLTALRIMSKIRRAFHVKLPLSVLVVNSATIANIASRIDEERMREEAA